ncbi:hypothetical protein F908_02690 [Acinetobacter sp. NIPH 284]|uniref:macro domain-containing protein n=1 Tax=Acinetobacter sp. NIPH 284 TaxID=1217704 RepID=UPI0002D04559|nr:macro domain-containing protein [Acinetobacter sp. NIPH 284]ENW79218.1 hypothetical protein F908_02690 [Acinetobacter sp. NIPH 284]
MHKITGDLIALAQTGEFDVIIHGCNCFCTMGAGIAKVIKQEFPEAYQADLNTIYGDKDKLGTYGQAHIKRDNYNFIIINAYTQFNWRGQGKKADYAAIKQVFRSIKKDFSAASIGYPMIGAGLAKGDWNIISAIIDEELEGLNHYLVVLPTP